MAKKAAKTTTLEAIEESLVAEATTFYGSFRQQNPEEHVYAFLFELSAVGYAANAAIATHESLHRFAEECADSYDNDLERAKDDLRWSSPENGWYQSPDEAFRATNRLLDIAERNALYPEYDGTLETLALAALKTMVSSGTFGGADALERMTLGICYTGGDNSDEEFLKWASAVNSPSVLERLKTELKMRA
jgi:hypothetical protein